MTTRLIAAIDWVLCRTFGHMEKEGDAAGPMAIFTCQRCLHITRIELRRQA